jgi:hypothetical protein
MLVMTTTVVTMIMEMVMAMMTLAVMVMVMMLMMMMMLMMLMMMMMMMMMMMVSKPDWPPRSISIRRSADRSLDRPRFKLLFFFQLLITLLHPTLFPLCCSLLHSPNPFGSSIYSIQFFPHSMRSRLPDRADLLSLARSFVRYVRSPFRYLSIFSRPTISYHFLPPALSQWTKPTCRGGAHPPHDRFSIQRFSWGWGASKRSSGRLTFVSWPNKKKNPH